MKQAVGVQCLEAGEDVANHRDSLGGRTGSRA